MYNSKKIVFATNNKKKLEEVRDLLAGHYEVLSLADIGCTDEVEETGTTFHENAALKAAHVLKKYTISCFADDSGLEVDALNGAPGVYSARFAGEEKSDAANNYLLLKKLEGLTNRRAAFKTVIAYCTQAGTTFFEGSISGQIGLEAKGHHGFGYDPLFIPDSYTETFAQLGPETKNKISHRAIAVNKLVDFLKKQD